jgi:hypothetical protein
MGMGFLQRMLDEAVKHCRERYVGGKSLFSYDQVQKRLSRLQSAYTVSSAMCLNSAGKAGLENNLSGIGVEANSVKTYVTDLMQESAQSLLQLVGAKGYRLDHIAGRSIVDSRPFQIFEGSNDILYIQIAESILKQMSAERQINLFKFFKWYELTSLAAGRLDKNMHDALGDIPLHLPQRRLAELGCLISRIIAVNMVLKLLDTGFNRKLIENCLLNLKQEISTLLSSYKSENATDFIDEYEENSCWFDLCK